MMLEAWLAACFRSPANEQSIDFYHEQVNGFEAFGSAAAAARCERLPS